MGINRINLPKTIGTWKLVDSPKKINSKNIFDYMNGSGELYLSYNFDHLIVYEYKNKSKNDILVELYYMKDSDDAFGLLSLDWGGETVFLHPSSEQNRDPFSRALYGKGLLRIWSDNLYVRIMSVWETPEVRNVILQLGKIITSGRKEGPPPQLLKVMPPLLGSPWKLKREKMGYFYNYLVLNSLYYLSHDNILGLDHSTEGVIAPYEINKEGRIQSRMYFLIIKYPCNKQAKKALDHFLKVYLPDKQKEKGKNLKGKNKDFFKIEDGWMGYQLTDRYVSLVFVCPDLSSAQLIINRVSLNIRRFE